MKQPNLLTFIVLLALLTVPVMAETTGTLTIEDGGRTFYVWGFALDYGLVLSWFLVPVAWALTEYAPVENDTKPLIPIVFGGVASILGMKVFGIDQVTAQLQFAAALSSGTMNGFIKKLIPWFIRRIRKEK